MSRSSGLRRRSDFTISMRSPCDARIIQATRSVWQSHVHGMAGLTGTNDYLRRTFVSYLIVRSLVFVEIPFGFRLRSALAAQQIIRRKVYRNLIPSKGAEAEQLHYYDLDGLPPDGLCSATTYHPTTGISRSIMLGYL